MSYENSMPRICPGCEKDTPIETVKGKETINVRGEKIRVSVEFYRCKTCGSEFENTRGPDALESAYRTYRERHGMPQPKAFRDWRKNHGLTQRDAPAERQKLYRTSAWVIRAPCGLYFGGFCDTRKDPNLKVKWVSGLCEAKLFGATSHAKVESYLKRIKEKDSLYVGLQAVEVEIRPQSHE